MDIAFLVILPTILWLQAWHLLGFYANPRTLGVTAAAVAIALLAIVLFQDKLVMTPTYPDPAPPAIFLTLATSLSAFVLLWAVYSALVAAVYLWGMDTRGLGFFSLLLCIISILFTAYFFLGGELLDSGDTNHVSWLLGVVAIMLAIMSALQFFYLGLLPRGQVEPPSSAMRTATGWVYLIFSTAIVVMGGLLLLGLNPTL